MPDRSEIQARGTAAPRDSAGRVLKRALELLGIGTLSYAL